MSQLLKLAPAVPLFYFAGLAVGALGYPGYSHVRDLPSDLGALGAPHATLFNVGIGLTALTLILVALAFGRATRRVGAAAPLAWAVGLSLALPGLCFLSVAAFPLPDPRHNAVFPLALPLHFAPFLLGAALRARQDLRSLVGFLILSGLLLLGPLALAFGVGNLIGDDNAGLLFRVYALLALGWLAPAGLLLSRHLRVHHRAVSAT